jgi:hypothetical protein
LGRVVMLKYGLEFFGAVKCWDMTEFILP